MRACAPFRFSPPEPGHRPGRGLGCLAGAALLALAVALPASAQTGRGGTRAQASSGDAKSDMAACNARKTAQERATCLDEVRRAQAAKRAGKLQNYGDFSANALKRCDIFKDSSVDMAACRARVLQEGNAEGSVAEGGILREVEIQMPPETPPTSDTQGTPTMPTTPAMPAEPAEPAAPAAPATQ